jgi:predicted metalloprotease
MKTPLIATLAIIGVALIWPRPMAAQARDRDRDGIADSLDRCPDQPETYNGHADSDGCPDSVATLFDLAKTSVDSFWSKEATSLSLKYAPPSTVTGYTTEIDTPCGKAELDNAFFCRVDRGLYFDLGFLGGEFRRGDFLPVVIVAHEWGHLMQFTANWEDPLPIRHELQADCYAGAYAQFADAQGMLEVGDTAEAINGLFRSGRTNIPWLAPGSHGSGGNRADAFAWGFENGAPACTGSVFMRKAGGVVPMFETARYPEGSLTDKVPLSVGDFTLVDVSRASEFITGGVTDMIKGKYRAKDGATLEHWIAALSTPEAAAGQFDRWAEYYRSKSYRLVAEDKFTAGDGTVTGRWMRFAKPDGREIMLWQNAQIVLVADGPAARTFEFSKQHPL